MFTRRFLSRAAAFGLAILTAWAVLSSTAQAHTRSLGAFEGRLVNGGTELPVVTTFYATSRGMLYGRYVMDEGGGVRTSGTLSDYRAFGGNGAIFKWRDKYGSGTLQIRFNARGDAFSGHWGMGSELAHAWDGARVGSTVARAPTYASEPSQPATDQGYHGVTGSAGGDLALAAIAAYGAWRLHEHLEEKEMVARNRDHIREHGYVDGAYVKGSDGGYSVFNPNGWDGYVVRKINDVTYEISIERAHPSCVYKPGETRPLNVGRFQAY